MLMISVVDYQNAHRRTARQTDDNSMITVRSDKAGSDYPKMMK